MIDQMVAMLRKEENTDLTIKEKCEADRSANTRDAILTSRAIDELTDQITALNNEIADLKGRIEAKQNEVKEMESQQKEADEMRDAEKVEYEKNEADDKEAVKLVQDATKVLQDYYTE